MKKPIFVNTTFMDLGDMTLLCMTFWTLCRRSTTSSARKPKVSKANGIKTCWLSEHVFSCLTPLLDTAFKAACPFIKGLTPNLTSGETLVKSTHTCFPRTHPYTITSTCLSVDLLSSWSFRKFTGVVTSWGLVSTKVCSNSLYTIFRLHSSHGRM